LSAKTVFFKGNSAEPLQLVHFFWRLRLFGSPKHISHDIGDVLVNRVTSLPFKIVEMITLNDIPHVRLRCQAPWDNSTKTIAFSALELTFRIPTGEDADLVPAT
jgi:hypothetical protein